MSTKIKYLGGPKGTTALSMHKSKKRGLPTLGFRQLTKPVVQATDVEIEAVEPILMLQFGGVEDIDEMIGALQHLRFTHTGEKAGIPPELVNLMGKIGGSITVIDLRKLRPKKEEEKKPEAEEKKPEEEKQQQPQ